MKLTLVSMKGGVAKTTTAVHLAALLAKSGSTILIDADPNHSACGWAGRGNLTFPVKTIRQAVGVAASYEHIIVDTQARPQAEELKELSEGCDLLIIPTSPDPLSMEGMMTTIETLRSFNATNFRVLLTIVPPEPIPEGRLARQALAEAQIPTFDRGIRRLMAFQRAAADGVTVDAIRDRNAYLGALDYEYVLEQLLSNVRSTHA